MKILIKVIIITLILGSGLGLGTGTGWAIPRLINYHGKLTNTSGVPVNGGVSMTFTLYDAASGGTNLWTETQSVTVNNGLYNVQLGNTTVLNPNVFSNPNVYLGVKVGADAEMTPRTQILAVGYAYRAATAEAALTLISTAEIKTTGTATFGALTVDTNTLYVDSANNRVGIGTTSPGVPLEVRGNIAALNPNANATISVGKELNDSRLYVQWDNANDKAVIGSWSSTGGAHHHDLLIYGKNIDFAPGGNSSVLYLKENATVGIGTDNPGNYKLYVNGTGYLGAAAWAYSSDRRLKENISPLKSGLDMVKKLNPVYFDYLKGEKKQVGFVAQDVQIILPDIITEASDGMLGMKTGSLIPYLVNSIKEQQTQIEVQADKIAQLQKQNTKIANLEKKIELLQSLIEQNQLANSN